MLPTSRRRRASALLGVPIASPARAVNKKYRELARAAHPDRGGDEDLFKELSAARDALLASDSDDEDDDYRDVTKRSTDFFHKLAVSLDEMYTGRVCFIGMKRDVVCEDGTSTESVRETLRVEVPRGARGGDQIVFEGKADEVPMCPTVGRLVFNIKELPHAAFRRSGAHLLHVHEMPLLDALCGERGGGVYDIEHLDARTLRVRTPRAREAFEVWRIAGEGMPLPREEGQVYQEDAKDTYTAGSYERKRVDEYGDLFCVRGVVFPDSLSESQRAVLKAVLPPAVSGSAVTVNDTSSNNAASSQYSKRPHAHKSNVRKKARLRAIKRSEFVNCISAFPGIYGTALYYEQPHRRNHASMPERVDECGEADVNSESVPNRKQSYRPPRSRRWSVDEDDGFDASALDEDDPGDCETQ